MHLAFTVLTVLFAFIYPVCTHRYSKEQNENPTTCKHSASVETFEASFYTALIVTQNRDVVHKLKLTGEQAGDKLYPIAARILKAKGLCDADMIAWTVSRAVAMVDTLKLTKYYKMTAYNVGEILEDNGLLNCKNAVSLALDYFKFARRALKGLDGNKFDSYMQGIVQGLVDLFEAHGLDLEAAVQKSADKFYKEFSTDKRDKCKLSQASK